MARVTVWATAQMPGFHRWPAAPEHRAYLRDRHRHLFHLRVEVEVRHDERDIEFHDLSDYLRDYWLNAPDCNDTGARELGSTSCESIAQGIAKALDADGWLDDRWWSVTVSEDGESGATVNA